MHSVSIAKSTQMRLVNLMADVACKSAQAHGGLLESFPDYRSAKDNLNDGFWIRDGRKMLSLATRLDESLPDPIIDENDY